MIRCALFIVATTLCVSATERKWEFIQPRPVNTSPTQQADSGAFPAWYHMPAKQQHAPAFNAFDRRDGAAFERPQQPVDNAYRGFTSFVRTPASAPSSPYVSESPSPRRGFPQPAQPDPNAELFNAIRDVVNKFKASLDESGLDQDVRHMSRQLQNTWHQLRAGNPRAVDEKEAEFRRNYGLDRSWNALRLSAEQSLNPAVIPYNQGSMNEQLSHMFSRNSQQDAPRRP